MKSIVYKAWDTILCLAGVLAVALIFAGIAAFGKLTGNLHCPVGFPAKYSWPYRHLHGRY